MFKYDKPRPAKLADGSIKDLVTGYCVADVELVTRAGPVILVRNHIDILDGPETSNLLYIGEAEERRLKLKSYAQQLEELAAKKGLAKKQDKEVCREGCSHEVKSREVKGSACLGPGEEKTEECSRYKAALSNKPVVTDGKACVGNHNWKVLRRTPLHL